jgi:hemolysin III
MRIHFGKFHHLHPERRRGPRLSQAAWRRQERASAYTHALAALLSLVGFWSLVSEAFQHGNLRHFISFTIFGLTLVILYAASTFMHSLPLGHQRRLFEELDLAGIFLLIAGTYTPFALVTLQGPLGWGLFAVIWILAAFGILGVHRHRKQFEKRAAAIYLAMGWLIVAAIKPLAQNLPSQGLALLVAGGITYSLGVIFFFWTRFILHHAIWHIFVMVGSFLHYLVIVLYVLPDMRGSNWLLP